MNEYLLLLRLNALPTDTHIDQLFDILASVEGCWMTEGINYIKVIVQSQDLGSAVHTAIDALSALGYHVEAVEIISETMAPSERTSLTA